MHACIGGTSVREDVDKIRQGQQLVVRDLAAQVVGRKHEQEGREECVVSTD